MLFTGSVQAAETVTITDVTGREVSVNVPVEHVILVKPFGIWPCTIDSEDPFARSWLA